MYQTILRKLRHKYKTQILIICKSINNYTKMPIETSNGQVVQIPTNKQTTDIVQLLSSLRNNLALEVISKITLIAT